MEAASAAAVVTAAEQDADKNGGKGESSFLPVVASNQRKGVELVRSARMDNFRCFLMILVVLGHLLELQEGPIQDYVYLVIYSFHMPLFVWISGYFAKYADRHCIRSLMLPYLVFQVLYSVAALYFWKTEEELKLLEPYWLMWFLMALFLWRLLLPLLDVKNLKQQVLALGVVLALALLTGWEQELRYVLSFQRMVALFPMFLLGYYCRGWNAEIGAWWQGQGKSRRMLLRIALALAVAVGFLVLYLFREEISHKWLYWKYPYGKKGGSVINRATLLAFAVVCLGAFMAWMPNRRIPVLTYIGQNTLPVYLLHGFVIKTLDHYGVMERVAHPGLWTLVILVGMLLLFSSPPVAGLFRSCFGRNKLIS